MSLLDSMDKKNFYETPVAYDLKSLLDKPVLMCQPGDLTKGFPVGKLTSMICGTRRMS